MHIGEVVVEESDGETLLGIRGGQDLDFVGTLSVLFM